VCFLPCIEINRVTEGDPHPHEKNLTITILVRDILIFSLMCKRKFVHNLLKHSQWIRKKGHRIAHRLSERTHSK
jgi:hypothetical protein